MLLDGVILVRVKLSKDETTSTTYKKLCKGIYELHEHTAFDYGDGDDNTTSLVYRRIREVVNTHSVPTEAIVLGFTYTTDSTVGISQEIQDFVVLRCKIVYSDAPIFYTQISTECLTIDKVCNQFSTTDNKSYKDTISFENLKRLISFYVEEGSNDATNGQFYTISNSAALRTAAMSLLGASNALWLSTAENESEERDTLFNEKDVWNSRRDYNRIVQSTAFRRMVDKAQIYGAEQGVLYRTRMTHTQIVARIARELAWKLNVDEQLAENIALAHDLGHTPFGHQGERTLAKKLEEYCGGLSGGFKHNYQSVRVMCLLEESYPDFIGMNVSWQVLEGALHHTKVLRKEENGIELICNFFQLDPIYLRNKKWFDDYVLHVSEETDEEYVPSRTVFGQIVALADEIAQRSHDVDDGIMSGRISCEEFVNDLMRFGYVEKAEEIRKRLDAVRVAKDKGRLYVDEVNVQRSVVSEAIIDVLVESLNTNVNVSGELKKTVVDLDSTGKAFMKYLERVVNRRVLSSQTVATFDKNAETIVGALYDRFVMNPDLLPPDVLRRYYIMQVAAGLKDALDFSDCDFDARMGEIKAITEMRATVSPKDKRDKKAEDDSKKWDDLLKQLDPNAEDEAKNKSSAWGEGTRNLRYLLKWIYLNRTVADYISSLTDAMAKDEFARVCKYGNSSSTNVVIINNA